MAGYGTDDALTAWLAAKGYDLPVGAPTKTVLRQRGSDYLDAAYGDRFTGQPTGGYAQERAWPRTNATYYGSSIPADAVPVKIEHASYEAAWQEASNPGTLTIATSASGVVKSEKVGPIAVEYAVGDDPLADSIVRLSAVEGLLGPFLIPETPAVRLGMLAIG